MRIAAQFCCTQSLLHAVFTAEFCCLQLFLQIASLRVNSFGQSSAEIYCTQFGAHVFDALRPDAQSFATYSTTRLLYRYMTTRVLLHTCLHYDATAILHLHCELAPETSRVCRVAVLQQLVAVHPAGVYSLESKQAKS